MSRRLLRSIPRSPFSTPLSGSARETEDRIRNIFQYKKKRPPLLLFILACALALTCGGLVSCQPASGADSAPPTGLGISMDIQYYDTLGNYIEIPTLTLPSDTEPDEGITAINQALAELKAEYTPLLSALEGGTAAHLDYISTFENRCLFYPTQTAQHLNLVFFRSSYTTDLNTGHVLTLVYDFREGRQITLEDALEAAGQTEAGLYQALADQYAPELAQRSQEITRNQAPDLPPANLAIHALALEGFRMKSDGEPVFYLTARVDDQDDAVSDAVSGSDNLYIWSGGHFELYDQYAPNLPPLVPLEEQLDQWFGGQPLWCQWSLHGGEPEGGFVTPSSPAPDSSEYPGGSSAAPASPDSESASEEDAVSSTSEDYGLWNLEYSLRRDGWETPAGPGMQTSALFFHEAGTRTEQPGEGLTQNEGDYWLTYEWDGFSARYYHLASNGSETLRTIDTTRADVSTQRGIRVGDSREDVLAAYPEAKSHSDRNPSLNEENCLWIAEDLEADRGLALLFYLDGDTVRQITLTRLL